MSKPKITNIRKAGCKHQVLEVHGGDGSYCKQPCVQCPWRKDQVGKFPASAFLHSANTSFDMSTHQFACHMAGAEKPKTCAGFLLNGSIHNLTIRLKLAQGEIDLKSITDGGYELFDNYREMAIANGVKATNKKIADCR